MLLFSPNRAGPVSFFLTLCSYSRYSLVCHIYYILKIHDGLTPNYLTTTDGQWIREGSIRQYVPSVEDARLISSGDSDASDEEDTNACDEVEDAEAHKGPPIHFN